MATRVDLLCYEPWEKQREFIDALGDGSGISTTHARMGRGSGKTLMLVVKVLRVGTEVNPGVPILVTEPTYRDCLDVFFRSWREVVPRDLWRFNRQDMTIHLINGTEIDLRSRMVDNSRKEPGRGPNYGAHFADELAKDRDSTAWDLMYASVRAPKARRLICDSTSTPKIGWYKQLLERSGCRQIVASSFENPYVLPEVFRQMEEAYSTDFASQELYANWVSQSGRVWDNWSEAPWPEGNIHHGHEYDPRLPYTLAVDLGLRSSWQVWQSIPAVDDKGRRVANGNIDVLVAEWTPTDGDATRMPPLIDAELERRPAIVVTGADNARRSTVVGYTARQVLTEHWAAIDLRQPYSDHTDKALQLHVAKGRICNSRGLRRVAISSNCRVFPRDSNRWLRECMQIDTWPEGRIGENRYLEKDKQTGGPGIEDTRDAYLYFCITKHPPIMAQRHDEAPAIWAPGR